MRGKEFGIIGCYKIVKAAPYPYVVGIPVQFVENALGHNYLKGPKGEHLLFNTEQEALDYMKANLKPEFIPPDMFRSILPDKEYFNYSALPEKPKYGEKGYKEWKIQLYDGDNDLVESVVVYSEKEKDAWINENFESDNWNAEVVVQLTEVTEVLQRTPKPSKGWE